MFLSKSINRKNWSVKKESRLFSRVLKYTWKNAGKQGDCPEKIKNTKAENEPSNEENGSKDGPFSYFATDSGVQVTIYLKKLSIWI